MRPRRGRLDGGVKRRQRVGGGGVGDLGDGLAGGRIFHLQGSVLTFPPLPADKELMRNGIDNPAFVAGG